jgi:hypothetical protein
VRKGRQGAQLTTAIFNFNAEYQMLTSVNREDNRVIMYLTRKLWRLKTLWLFSCSEGGLF